MVVVSRRRGNLPIIGIASSVSPSRNNKKRRIFVRRLLITAQFGKGLRYLVHIQGDIHKLQMLFIACGINLVLYLGFDDVYTGNPRATPVNGPAQVGSPCITVSAYSSALSASGAPSMTIKSSLPYSSATFLILS
jgi:hypothetical protein